MAKGKRSSKDVKVSITDTTTEDLGDAYIDISSQIRSFPGTRREWLSESYFPLSSTTEKHDPVGCFRVPDITLVVAVDDTAATAYRILLAAAEAQTILSIKIEVGDVIRHYDFFVPSDGEEGEGGALFKGSFTLRCNGDYSVSVTP